MNKKIFALLIVAILAIVSIGGVYALDIGGILSGDSQTGLSSGNEVTVDGIKFNVPDGFEEYVTNSSTQYNKTVNGIAYFSTIKNYVNDNDTLSLTVSKNPSHKATDDTAREYGGEKETINGIDGYLEYHPQKVTKFRSGNYIYTLTYYPYYTFAYAQDDKLVVVSSSEKEYFSDVLVKQGFLWG